MSMFNKEVAPTKPNSNLQLSALNERLNTLVDGFDELQETLDKLVESVSYVTTKVEILEVKINDDLHHDRELREYKEQLRTVNLFVQNMLTTMITHKVSEPDASPAVKAYLERKTNGSSCSKLPLP